MIYRCMMAAIALLIAAPGVAQVYRCEADGVVAFSDRPCGPDSAMHTSPNRVNFVVPDENLPELAEAAQAFIRARRERLARAADSRRQAAAPVPAPAENPQTVYVPWPVTGHHRYEKRSDRSDPPPPNIADNDRYSPLNGPMPGTRRNNRLFSKGRPGGERERQR